MSTKTKVYKMMRDVAEAQSTISTGMTGLQETTVSGYRSTHATQLFRQGVSSPVMYSIGYSGNTAPPIVQ